MCVCVGKELPVGECGCFFGKGVLQSGRLWGWNGKAALLFLLHAYYLILFYSNSSAPSVTLRERSPSAGSPSLSLSLFLSLTGHSLSLFFARFPFSGWLGGESAMADCVNCLHPGHKEDKDAEASEKEKRNQKRMQNNGGKKKENCCLARIRKQ